MATRTVKVATWQYFNAKGQRRRAYFGDEIDLPKAEVERGDREGVFTPEPIPAASPSELGRALAKIDPRFDDPAGAAESDAAPLHHDIQPTLDSVESSIEDEPETEQTAATGDEQPGDGDAASTEQTAATGDDSKPAVELKRPAKAAAHEKWVDYVHQATGRPADELAELSKDELQAIEV